MKIRASHGLEVEITDPIDIQAIKDLIQVGGQVNHRAISNIANKYQAGGPMNNPPVMGMKKGGQSLRKYQGDKESSQTGQKKKYKWTPGALVTAPAPKVTNTSSTGFGFTTPEATGHTEGYLSPEQWREMNQPFYSPSQVVSNQLDTENLPIGVVSHNPQGKYRKPSTRATGNYNDQFIGQQGSLDNMDYQQYLKKNELEKQYEQNAIEKAKWYMGKKDAQGNTLPEPGMVSVYDQAFWPIVAGGAPALGETVLTKALYEAARQSVVGGVSMEDWAHDPLASAAAVASLYGANKYLGPALSKTTAPIEKAFTQFIPKGPASKLGTTIINPFPYQIKHSIEKTGENMVKQAEAGSLPMSNINNQPTRSSPVPEGLSLNRPYVPNSRGAISPNDNRYAQWLNSQAHDKFRKPSNAYQKMGGEPCFNCGGQMAEGGQSLTNFPKQSPDTETKDLTVPQKQLQGIMDYIKKTSFDYHVNNPFGEEEDQQLPGAKKGGRVLLPKAQFAGGNPWDYDEIKRKYEESQNNHSIPEKYPVDYMDFQNFKGNYHSDDKTPPIVGPGSTVSQVGDKRYGIFNTKNPHWLTGRNVNKANVSIHTPGKPGDWDPEMGDMSKGTDSIMSVHKTRPVLQTLGALAKNPETLNLGMQGLTKLFSIDDENRLAEQTSVGTAADNLMYAAASPMQGWDVNSGNWMGNHVSVEQPGAPGFRQIGGPAKANDYNTIVQKYFEQEAQNAGPLNLPIPSSVAASAEDRYPVVAPSTDGYNASLARHGSEQVRQTQQALNRKGANLAEDGAWGPKTQAAWDKYINKKSSNKETPKALPRRNRKLGPDEFPDEDIAVAQGIIPAGITSANSPKPIGNTNAPYRWSNGAPSGSPVIVKNLQPIPGAPGKYKAIVHPGYDTGTMQPDKTSVRKNSSEETIVVDPVQIPGKPGMYKAMVDPEFDRGIMTNDKTSVRYTAPGGSYGTNQIYMPIQPPGFDKGTSGVDNTNVVRMLEETPHFLPRKTGNKLLAQKYTGDTRALPDATRVSQSPISSNGIPFGYMGTNNPMLPYVSKAGMKGMYEDGGQAYSDGWDGYLSDEEIAQLEAGGEYTIERM